MIREKNIEKKTSITGMPVVINLREARLKADLQADMSDIINQAQQLI